MSSKEITEDSWIDESIQESVSMSVSLPRSRGSNEKRGPKGVRQDTSGSKIMASKISSEYIPEEEHESSIIDEVAPAGG
jgi:hypothetical protein